MNENQAAALDDVCAACKEFEPTLLEFIGRLDKDLKTVFGFQPTEVKRLSAEFLKYVEANSKLAKM